MDEETSSSEQETVEVEETEETVEEADETVEVTVEEEHKEEPVEVDESVEAEGEPSKKYIYLSGALGLWSCDSEEELKKRYPRVCDPGEHDWQQSCDLKNLDICSNCGARREQK